MKKKLKIVICLICAFLICVGLSACSSLTELEEKQQEGYKITVRYEANGGSFLNRPGITLVDMFNPSDYQADANGEIHIRLIEPTDPSRPSNGDKITLTLADHFFAGWYATREVKTVDGVPVDEDGKVLKLQDDGSYVYADKPDTTAMPAYVYSDYWDFENDTVDYSETEHAKTDGVYELTLYAGWVQYYEFRYYYKMENSKDSEWTAITEKTKFDYKTTNAEASKTFDRDTIRVPEWDNGVMNHTHSYADGALYQFPKVEGTTFLKAYTDPNCKNEITDSFEHTGSLNLAMCEAIDRVQNIYILLEKGERYKITTAEQLVKNPNAAGIYEILNDLDFDGLTWSQVFSQGTFTGSMYASVGTVTLRNISAKHASASATRGGLFGSIGAGARIENLTFENATFDLSNTGQRLRNTTFGLFAGNIDEKASISGVTVGGTFKIGKITLGDNYSINLLANGNVKGITTTKIALRIYGVQFDKKYLYTVRPDETTVDSEYNVVLKMVTGDQLENEWSERVFENGNEITI